MNIAPPSGEACGELHVFPGWHDGCACGRYTGSIYDPVDTQPWLGGPEVWPRWEGMRSAVC